MKMARSVSKTGPRAGGHRNGMPNWPQIKARIVPKNGRTNRGNKGGNYRSARIFALNRRKPPFGRRDRRDYDTFAYIIVASVPGPRINENLVSGRNPDPLLKSVRSVNGNGEHLQWPEFADHNGNSS